MTIAVDEHAVIDRLRPVLGAEGIQHGLRSLVDDPFCLSVFLMGLSEGEGLGEAGVAAIRQEELAALIHDLQRQELEEHGHMAGARLVAEELFPGDFEHGRYKYPQALTGREYYLKVREANRTRLKAMDKYSRLNLYLTTTFGYEIMVELLFEAVLDALASSTLPEPAPSRVGLLLTIILRQEETHLGIIDQHNALLATDRSDLSAEAGAMLDSLGALTAEDYVWAAELAMQEIGPTLTRYADPAAFREQVLASAA